MICRALILVAACAAAAGVWAQAGRDLSGLEIMQEARRRHHTYDSLYEELSIILVDGHGNRSTRNVRKYTRGAGGDDMKFLLLFDSPAEVHGVGLLALKAPDRDLRLYLYLPAHGDMISRGLDPSRDDSILGMDLGFTELAGEFIGDNSYVRREDRLIENVRYLLVDVYRDGEEAGAANPVRRHYVREDSFFVARTDYLDRYGRLEKQLTQYDLKQIDAGLWGAGMTLMENLRENHSTLIKVNRRIFSEDFVPEQVFTFNWLIENQPPPVPEPPGGDTEAAPPGETNGVRVIAGGAAGP